MKLYTVKYMQPDQRNGDVREHTLSVHPGHVLMLRTSATRDKTGRIDCAYVCLHLAGEADGRVLARYDERDVKAAIGALSEQALTSDLTVQAVAARLKRLKREGAAALADDHYKRELRAWQAAFGGVEVQHEEH